MFSEQKNRGRLSASDRRRLSLKRALKKKMKAVLVESTINNDVASIEHSSLVTPLLKHRMPKAAMIGLAISMGATSLFVTRQSDQALAAEPVGNQNTASTILLHLMRSSLLPHKNALLKPSPTRSGRQFLPWLSQQQSRK